jgi:hypothetical protein
MLRDPTSSKWKKYWIVLRRPYLHLYESSSETEETAVINVSTVRVEQSPEIEQMLEVSPSFTPSYSQSLIHIIAQILVRDLHPPKLVRLVLSL